MPVDVPARPASGSAQGVESMTKRPNVLVILADQLRRSALGIYGDPNVSTPNIDRLAQHGVRFSHAYSSCPQCVPFRFSLMTGERAPSRFPTGNGWRMSPAERTLADALNENDYETVYIGKWHLYGIGFSTAPPGVDMWRMANRTPVPRQHQGRWQNWFGFELSNRHFDTCYFVDDDPTPRPLGEYQTDGLTNLTMDYLRRRRPGDRPFFCILSVEPPHNNLEAPPAYEDKWRQRDIVTPPNFLFDDPTPGPGRRVTTEPDQLENHLKYVRLQYAMIENLDDNVGRLLRCLHDTGLDEDTIVVFLSDHGDMGGAHRLFKKHQPFEESVGIPFVVRDPRMPDRAGSTLDDPVQVEDLYPTFLGMTGCRAELDKPGVDLCPLIRGEQKRLSREGILLGQVRQSRGWEMWRAFRSPRYKYTALGDPTGGKPWQFFDLNKDPYEMTNLVHNEESADLVRSHHRHLLEHLATSQDHFVVAPAWGEPGFNTWS